MDYFYSSRILIEMKYSVKDLEKQIESSEGTLLYFSSPKCSVCHVWKPKVFTLFHKEVPGLNLIDIDIKENPEIAGKFGVFTAPILLVFFDSREFFRESKNVNLQDLNHKINRIKNLIGA